MRFQCSSASLDDLIVGVFHALDRKEENPIFQGEKNTILLI